MNRRGFTIIETMLAMIGLAVVMLAGVTLLSPTLTFFGRTQARVEADMEVRGCMDVMKKLLSNAQPNTVIISTPLLSPPNSKLQFVTVNNSSYTVTWSAAPENSVHLLTANGNTIIHDEIIAHHVTAIIFTSDFRDPSIMYVSLDIDVPLKHGPVGSYPVFLPNQIVRMAASK